MSYNEKKLTNRKANHVQESIIWVRPSARHFDVPDWRTLADRACNLVAAEKVSFHPTRESSVNTGLFSFSFRMVYMAYCENPTRG